MIKIFIEDISSIDETTYKKILLSLPQKRIEKILHLKYKHDRYRSLLAGKLVHDHLKEYEHLITVNEFGKPYIKGNPIYFSLSHSGEKVMLVISNKEIGCDIEYIKDKDLDIAKRFFNENEYQEIISSDNPKELFFKYWTLKEAALKCRGTGLTDSLTSIHIKNGKLVDDIYEVVESKLVFDHYYIAIVTSR